MGNVVHTCSPEFKQVHKRHLVLAWQPNSLHGGPGPVVNLISKTEPQPEATATAGNDGETDMIARA